MREAEEALEGVEVQMVTGQMELQLILVHEGILAVAADELCHIAGETTKNNQPTSGRNLNQRRPLLPETPETAEEFAKRPISRLL